MYGLYTNNIKTYHTIPMLYIQYTYDQSTYPNVDHSQHGQTWSTGKDQNLILGPIPNAPRLLPSTYHIRCETTYSYKIYNFSMCECKKTQSLNFILFFQCAPTKNSNNKI